MGTGPPLRSFRVGTREPSLLAMPPFMRLAGVMISKRDHGLPVFQSDIVASRAQKIANRTGD